MRNVPRRAHAAAQLTAFVALTLRTSGRTTGLNIERVYQTAVPAEDVAKTLAEHFRVREFEAQVFARRGCMQARKESLWRQLLGVTYAITVVISPGEGKLSIGLGGHASNATGAGRRRPVCAADRRIL